MLTSNTPQKTTDQPSENNLEYFPPPEDETFLEAIYEAAVKINPLSLIEIAADPFPPKAVQEVIEALCMLLGIPADWNRVKSIITEEKLVPMIEEFHPEAVPDLYLEQLSQITSLEEMQMGYLVHISDGVGQIGEWLHSIAVYYDAKHKPMTYEFVSQQQTIEPEAESPKKQNEESSKEMKKSTEVPKKEEPKKEKEKPKVSIKEALEAIKNLNLKDITEVRGYKTPPPGVLLVLEALCILFDCVKMERKGPNLIVCEANYKKLLQDTEGFIKRVLNLDFDKISADKIKKLRIYIAKPEFEIEKVKKASKAASGFALLLISIVQKYDEQKV